MANIYAYITFNGNCREAMNFYQQCLGGELTLQTVGESPMADKMPAQMKDSILHANLTNQTLVLMGSDLVGENGLNKGNSITLMLNCDSEEQIRKLYTQLSEGGKQTYPLENTFWGALFGNLTDKYGTHWALNFVLPA